MKNLSTLSFLGLVLAIVACQPQRLADSVDQSGAFYPDDLPSAWTMLTSRDGQQTIFHPCDANNTTIEIRGDTLYINWGQEEGFYTITGATRSDPDKITLTARQDIGEQPDRFIVEFLDPKRETARWFVWLNDSTSALFADSRMAAKYPTVKQPCSECWGDDVCDEQDSTSREE